MPLNILIVALGSHGDTHPFVALGQTLQRRGHRVMLLANGVFESLVTSAGLSFVPLNTIDEYHALTQNPDLWHPSRGFSVIMNAAVFSARKQIELLGPRIEPGNTVVVGSTIAFGARLAREKFNVPVAMVHLAPAIIRSIDAPPVFGGLPLPRNAPRWLKRFVFAAIDKLIVNRTVMPPLNAFTAEIGLPRIDADFLQWIHSPDLTLGLWPAWFGPPQGDWPPSLRLTGFPLYDERDVAPDMDAVEKFLAAGTPPVLFTPGSAMRFGQSFFAAAVTACSRLGRRAILLTRFKEQIPPSLPDGVIHVDYVPFSLILPRAAALVHHGGIGTMSQALAAGTPQIVMPMGHDQFDNADRAQRLGVSQTVPGPRFGVKSLTKALKLILDNPAVADSAHGVAERFKNHNPLEESAVAIESLAMRGANTI